MVFMNDGVFVQNLEVHCLKSYCTVVSYGAVYLFSTKPFQANLSSDHPGALGRVKLRVLAVFIFCWGWRKLNTNSST